MSKISKGAYYERKAKKILEDAGYLVHKAVRTRWDGGDLWDLFDLAAINKQGLRLIQVKVNKYLSEIEREQIKLFPSFTGISKEFWRFIERKKEPIIEVLDS